MQLLSKLSMMKISCYTFCADNEKCIHIQLQLTHVYNYYNYIYSRFYKLICPDKVCCCTLKGKQFKYIYMHSIANCMLTELITIALIAEWNEIIFMLSIILVPKHRLKGMVIIVIYMHFRLLNLIISY